MTKIRCRNTNDIEHRYPKHMMWIARHDLIRWIQDNTKHQGSGEEMLSTDDLLEELGFT